VGENIRCRSEKDGFGQRTCLAGDMVADVDLLVVEQHAVDGLDSVVGSLAGFVVHEAVALGVALLIGGDFAGQDISESGEGVVKGLCDGTWSAQVRRDTEAQLGCGQSAAMCGRKLTLLSICSSRFLMKMLPAPVFRSAGSRCDHMMRLSMKDVRGHGERGRLGHVPGTVFDKRVVELIECALA